MSGPTSHVGGWHFPAVAAAAPPYVADYRYIPGWVPGMPRPPLPWQRDPNYNRGGDNSRLSHSGHRQILNNTHNKRHFILAEEPDTDLNDKYIDEINFEKDKYLNKYN